MKEWCNSAVRISDGYTVKNFMTGCEDRCLHRPPSNGNTLFQFKTQHPKTMIFADKEGDGFLKHRLDAIAYAMREPSTHDLPFDALRGFDIGEYEMMQEALHDD